MLWGLLLLLLSLCVIVHQYLTRKTLRSVAMLIAGFAFIWLSCHYYLWDTLAHALLGIRNSDSIVASIEIGPITKPEAFITYGLTNSFPLYQPIMGTLDLRHIPAQNQVALMHLSGKLSYPSGKKINFDGDSGIYYGEGNALQTLLPGFEWFNINTPNPRITLLSVYKNTYKDLSTEAGTYTGEAQFDVYQSKIASETPLLRGSQININQNPITIREVETYPKQGNVVVRMDSLGLTTRSYDGDFRFCLLNRTRRQAFPLNSSSYVLEQALILFGVDLVNKDWSNNSMA
ncbi:MAG TPA: hypothetical protein VMG30_08880, partial [Acidobacteriota bacterium]|nr:hypothetical protein [Acidobacteriota bacterium]